MQKTIVFIRSKKWFFKKVGKTFLEKNSNFVETFLGIVITLLLLSSLAKKFFKFSFSFWSFSNRSSVLTQNMKDYVRSYRSKIHQKRKKHSTSQISWVVYGNSDANSTIWCKNEFLLFDVKKDILSIYEIQKTANKFPGKSVFLDQLLKKWCEDKIFWMKNLCIWFGWINHPTGWISNILDGSGQQDFGLIIENLDGFIKFWMDS